MKIPKKVAAALAGGGIVVAAALGTAGVAVAETTDDPADTTSCGQADGWMGGMAGPGMMAGYGTSALAEYLADELGVATEDVTAALAEVRPTDPDAVRGRDLSDAARTDRHDTLTAELADALGVPAEDVTAALDAFRADHQADRGGHMRGMMRGGFMSGFGANPADA